MTGRKYRDVALFIVMVLVWSLNWPVMKVGLTYSSPIRFTSQRLALAAVSLFAYHLYVRRKIVSSSFRLSKELILYGFIGAAQLALVSIGLKYQESGVSAVLTYVQPILVFLLATRFLGEEFTLARLTGILLGFFGVLLLFTESYNPTLSLASLCLLAGALLWAAGTVYYKLKLEEVEPSTVNLIQVSVATLLLLITGFLLEPPAETWSINYLLILAYSGPIAMGGGVTIWLILLKGNEATVLSGSSFLVPVTALLLSWITLGEHFGLKKLIGSLLVVLGVYLVNFRTGHVCLHHVKTSTLKPKYDT